IVLTDGIPGVSVGGSGTAKSDTFEITDSSADISFIRAGGIIKIDGSYYNIKSVSDSTVTFDGTLAQDVTSAIFPYALSVNYKTTTSESSAWSDGTYSVGNDDGDGLVETVAKSGAKWTCTASLLSDSIADGTIVLHAVAIDAAGNVSSDVTTRTMISNHAPRLAKVHLATDLNGDGSYSSDEIEEFSALDDNGKSQEVVTLATDIYDFNSKIPDNTNKKTNAKAYFKVTGDLVVAPEFVGGHKGQGSVYYDAVIGSKSEPTWNSTGKLHGELADSNNKVADITAGITEGRNNVLKYLTLSASAMAGFNKEDNTDTIALSFWDSSEVYGFKGDKNSGYKADGNKIADGTASKLADSSSTLYSNFGYQWTVANIPVYFDITDDVAPTGTITPFYWKKVGSSEGKVNDGSNSIYYKVTGESPNYSYKPFGHIELGETPEVSGTVVLTGKVSDDQLMEKVEVEFTLGSTVTTISASYTDSGTASVKKWTLNPDSKTVTADGYEFIMSNDELTQAGHSADWTLYLDTAKLGNAETKTVTVKVTQAKSATETVNNTSKLDSTKGAETGYYAMRVVPYITGIARSGTTNRSRLGRYAVQEGETVTVSGFNFGTGGTVQVGNNESTSYTCTSDSSAASGATSFTMTVPAKSGGVVVKSGGISSTNNTNNNDGHGTAPKGESNSYRLNYYNREAVADNSLTTDYTDDRYLSVWALGNYFKGTDGGVELQKPVMTADKTGNLYASWGTPSNGSITFNYGVNNNSTSIFNCYDQPANETSVAFDTKGDSSSAAVLFFGEQQGNGGTWSNVAIASNTTIGGAFTTQIKATDISANESKGQKYTTKKDVVSGNPRIFLDDDNTSGFYTLASYDMQRRLGAYNNPRNARYKGYLHNVWYDSVNESLKYSVVNMDEEGITSKYAGKSGAFAGVVVLDGGYTAQDRCHEWTVDTGTTNQNIGYATDNEKGQSTTKKSGIKFTNDVFMASLTNKYGDVYDKLVNSGRTLSWNTALVYDDYYTLSDGKTKVKTLSEGATVAILDNTIGAYKIALRTFKFMAADKKSLVWEGNDLPVGFKPCSFAIYGGNMNVVDGDDDANDATSNFSTFSPTDQSNSAGLSADIDVTSTGNPVVAYYDATNSKLKVAYADSTEPKLASDWTRVDTGLSCSGEVSMRVDSNNGIHIMFMDAAGQLCYAYAASTANLGSSMKAEVIDTNGSLSYGSISVKEDSSGVVIPTVTYLNRANTEDCIKYAYRTAAAGSAGEWDYQIVPSMGIGHRAIAENKISLESRKAGWKGTGTGVLQNGGTAATPAMVDSVIAFKSKRFETAYLKSE
ncbi:MAG: hypothetical protein Q4P83_02875, partial [Spirochaetales bacterium]|nr:hypothetical protein [Spirochaetales bacterium]